MQGLAEGHEAWAALACKASPLPLSGKGQRTLKAVRLHTQPAEDPKGQH